jgi:exonuclease 3'-5' domain-containing protein 1
MSSLSLPLPGYPTASYRVCTTPESLEAAADVLLQHSHIILDCEGHSLGEVGGKLSLLNLGVSHEDDAGDEHLSIFVIDVLAFQNDKEKHLIPIFDILKSENIFKIVFDGRMDSSELLHGHGIKLNNVLDLQLADISSREKRGEGIDRQLQRLEGFLPKYELARNPTMYSSVQRLNGMGSAMREYGIPGANKRGERC